MIASRTNPATGGLARWAYALLLWLLAPIYVLRLLWRARSEPLYAQALGERFGFYAPSLPARNSHDSHKSDDGRNGDPGKTTWVWVHAVSLGETRAAAALIDALRARQPALRLLLTHGTATGRQAGQVLLRPGDVQVWLPYDTPGAVRRFLARFEPAVGVLMETEIWPQLLHQAEQRGLPMWLANGRLSERSLRRGHRWRALLRPAAQSLHGVMAQTEADAQRFTQAGVRHVRVCGNLKFDMQPDPGQQALGRAWREDLGRCVVLAASTREGEEGPLLAVWKAQVAGLASAPLLLIVPRHPQRFDEVAALIKSCGLRLKRRSQWTWETGVSPHPEVPQREHAERSDAVTQAWTADVWLGDSVGEMALYYSAAHVALLGGSFAPLGGQNLIEAAACGCPVVMGPHTFNFAQAAEMAEQAGAAWRATDVDAAVARCLSGLASGEWHAVSAQARQFALRYQGASKTMAAHILGAAG